MFLYSLGGIVMSYVSSFFAKSPPAGFALIIILNILVGELLISSDSYSYSINHASTVYQALCTIP